MDMLPMINKGWRCTKPPLETHLRGHRPFLKLGNPTCDPNVYN